jgi:hypothetical protein
MGPVFGRKKKTLPPVWKPPEKPESLEDRVSLMYDRFMTRSAGEVNGMFEMMGSRKRLIWINFLAGLGRGVGFFLGVTLIGGLVIGATAFLLDKTAATIGLKDVTFASMVRSVYSKFEEVQHVISNIESEHLDPEVDALLEGEPADGDETHPPPAEPDTPEQSDDGG